MIAKNIEKIKAEIPDDVKLIVVTKYHSLEETQAVLDAGIVDLGESRVQDFLKKQEILGELPRWHFIGHLQKNKVKYLVGKVFLIHSVDSIELLDIIQRESKKKGVITSVLLQFNLAREDSKSGFLKEELLNLLEVLPKYDDIKIEGLMAIGPLTESNVEIRNVFVELKQIYDKINNKSLGKNINMKYLSMGMTDDYKIAIKEGSNMIRIGRKIFSR
jgi:pyridoxal phosphate enzyme (YggS family)